MIGSKGWMSGIGLGAMLIAGCGDDAARSDGGTPPVDAALEDAGRGTDASTPVDGGEGVDGSRPDAGVDPALASLTATAAAAVCGVFERCCDPNDVDRYFASHRESPIYEDLVARFPTDGEFAPGECAALVEDMMDRSPFGDWVAHANAGLVDFDEDAFDGCVATLDAASCGTEVSAALFDGTCLGLGAPAGGEEQRAMFTRTGSAGDPCRPIRDGIGAGFYGTCDPQSAFCCYADPANPDLGCTFPFDGDGVPREGVCQAASAAGGSCALLPPLQLCATGLDCDDEAGECLASPETPLEHGETCIDDDFFLLGECTDGWCDIFGSKACEPLKADGASCSGGGECMSGACPDGACGAPTFCTGEAMAPMDGGMPDAGVEDGGVDAGMGDAGVPMGDGETCASAPMLSASSTASAGSYDYEVSASYGASNDTNPLMSSGLEPGCSFVYDAIGNDRVYAITIAPGQTLRTRLSPSPTSARGALYLLDSCAPVSWPDYDESGACGNNEYAVQGFCSIGVCDPVEWSWTHPAAVGGSPTTTQTFYLVVDALDAATEFTLEWSLTGP